jgi:spore coat protein A, manganese oxidase
MTLSRRDAIKLGVFATATLTLPVGRMVSASTQQRIATSRLPRPYTIPFGVPPVLAPVGSTVNADLYQVEMQAASVEILPGYRTTIFGYGGTFPGPTIVAEHGRPVVVRHINRLPARHPTLGQAGKASVHLHGVSSLPQFDGYANDLIGPGQYKDYWYGNEQDARTVWYHDHAVHNTRLNVYAGLAGMYVVRDPFERSLPLPQGRYDVPLAVSDALFDDRGQLMWDGDERSGMFGDVILVNGRPWPVMQVERRKYRFRVLNASVARTYRWRLSTGDPFTVVATDCGLMPAPQAVTELRHGNGERYEVVIDFAKYPKGRRVELVNLSTPNNLDYENTNRVMAFDVVDDATSTSGNSVPDVLNPSNPAMGLSAAAATRERRMELIRTNGMWTINGKTWADVEASGFRNVLAAPALGEVEIWDVRNDSGGWHHPFHIHLVDFRVLDRVLVDDRIGRKRKSPPAPLAPYPGERGPKDVVYVGENERVRLLMQFGPHPGKYMVHCHHLVHEDHDMMGQFEVGSEGVDPMSAPARDLPAPDLSVLW